MSLEDLLKPVKWLDKQVLTLYARIGQHISEENLGLLASSLVLCNIAPVSYLQAKGAEHISSFESTFYAAFGIIVLLDITANFKRFVTFEDKNEISADKTKEKYTPDIYYNAISSITRLARLPLFAVGIGFLAKGICEGYTSLADGKPLVF